MQKTIAAVFLLMALTACSDDDATTWDCLKGDCIEVFSDFGAYSTRAECSSSCSAPPESSCDSITLITDSRDNQSYAIVQIGNQCWFAENLRYAGSLPNVTADSTWIQTTGAAWCFYNNNGSNNDLYGKLYNWHAVNTGTICPKGWHIPTEREWRKLVNFVEASNNFSIGAANSLKDTTGWDVFNFDATNSSGFSALPGGFRQSSNGDFVLEESDGFWWSSTENDTLLQAAFISLNSSDDNVLFGFTDPRNGFSCRCVKD